MFNAHSYIRTFYEDHVRLGQASRAELAEHRDVCLELLKEGLRRLGEKRRRRGGYPVFMRTANQGSYAMKTLNQHSHKQYDIDVAVIFRKEDFPESALLARQRVAEALRASLNNFATKPLARTNAVTVWYTKGEHVDLAVYREFTNFWGKPVLEHAGSQWRPRDPEAVREWLVEQEQRLSPDAASRATVEQWQFRRIVRLVKAFARSRVSWDLPGGMILSALVAEVYRPDSHRDDIALYKTLSSLQSRLRENLEVRSPIAPNEVLTSLIRIVQVKRLLEKLDFVLPHLEVLNSPSCLETHAITSWGWVFNHPYWRERARNARLAAARIEPALLKIRANLSNFKNGPVKSAYKDKTAVPKGTWVGFSLKNQLGIPSPFTVRWVVRNRGSEALNAGVEQREYVGEELKVLWLEAKFAGRHSITCEIIKGGSIIARGGGICRFLQLEFWPSLPLVGATRGDDVTTSCSRRWTSQPRVVGTCMAFARL